MSPAPSAPPAYAPLTGVDNWMGIVQVAAGILHTVGLKNNGTAVTNVSDNPYQSGVEDWTGIYKVAAGSSHTVGLKNDGTVVAAGPNEQGQCDVEDWDLTPGIAGGYFSNGGA